MASPLNDILTSLQSGVTAMNTVGQQLARQVPNMSSGTVTASKLIQVGPVRLHGVSIIVAGAAGLLHDAALASDAASGNAIYVTQATIGYYPLQLIFLNGLVYVPGASQEASFHFSRLV